MPGGTDMGLFRPPGDDVCRAAGIVAALIEEWSPQRFRTEKAYEISLYCYLHDNLTDYQVTRQYARGRVRADIVVEDHVVLEIKNNLESTTKYHRLIGQLSEFRNWSGHIIIVLCGDTDRNIRKELDRFLADSGMFQGDDLRVIQK